MKPNQINIHSSLWRRIIAMHWLNVKFPSNKLSKIIHTNHHHSITLPWNVYRSNHILRFTWTLSDRRLLQNWWYPLDLSLDFSVICYAVLLFCLFLRRTPFVREASHFLHLSFPKERKRLIDTGPACRRVVCRASLHEAHGFELMPIFPLSARSFFCFFHVARLEIILSTFYKVSLMDDADRTRTPRPASRSAVLALNTATSGKYFPRRRADQLFLTAFLEQVLGTLGYFSFMRR